MQPSNLARPTLLAWTLLAALAVPPAGAIRRDPNGVNVNAQGATSVFITFGDLRDQVPVEAAWCGAILPAAPDIGFRCDPSTIFGRLPIRFDRSRLGADGTVFTDIMTIPPSVARRAYQAAERGETSTFFYVRRFVSLAGGPDEYVFVTCRMSGGGARTPLALLDVRLAFAEDRPVLSIERGRTLPPITAEISYNGTGRLRGRWEIVLPGSEPPESRDLLTEATLPPEERHLQRRYTQIARFDEFLPPAGHFMLAGPEPGLLPTEADGLYLVLLRIEASDDKEGNSDLANAGAGFGVVHSGGVAGFPMPVLRYVVGSADSGYASIAGLALLAPGDGARVAVGEPLTFAWSQTPNALLYRIEIADDGGQPLHRAVLQQGIGIYRAPSFVAREPGSGLRWRVVALGGNGEELGETEWFSVQRVEDGPPR